MNKVKSQNYINIQGWMLNLGCKSLREVMAYALVYGFSQDNSSQFQGSIPYIQEWLMCSSKHTAIDTLKSLEDMGLIKKEQFEINNVKMNHYTAIVPNEVGGSAKIALPVQKLHGGSAKIAPNNNIYNYNTPPLSKDNTPQGDDREIVAVEEVSDEEQIFDKFRKAYNGTKRGLKTEFENFKKKHKDWRTVLPMLLNCYQRQYEMRQAAIRNGCFVPIEKHLQTYINQRCWEDEPHFEKQTQTTNTQRTTNWNTEEGRSEQAKSDAILQTLWDSIQ